MKLLQEKCPGAIKTIDLKSCIGRIVACDASMVIKYKHKNIKKFTIKNNLLTNIVYLPIFNINTTY